MTQKNADPKVRVRHFGHGHWLGLTATAFADAGLVRGLTDPHLGLSEVCKRLPEFVVDDLVLHHDQLLEECLVEQAPER